MSELTEDQPRDFIALELLGGLPVLNIDHGSGSIPLSLDGRDLNGNQIIPTLADGKWHKIEIIRTGKVRIDFVFNHTYTHTYALSLIHI